MNLLAIDTSTDKASVALLSDKQIIEQVQDSIKTHAQFVLPMVDDLLNEADLALNQLDAIIFGCGPGSFTGLRIACSVAKGLAYAHDLKLIPVSSLATIAWATRQEEDRQIPILALLDARMHEVYWSYYSNTLCAPEQVSPIAEINISDSKPFIVAGVGIEEYWPYFPKSLQEKVLKKITCYPSAKAMIGLVQDTDIQPVVAAQASPVYVRNKVTYDKKN